MKESRIYYLGSNYIVEKGNGDTPIIRSNKPGVLNLEEVKRVLAISRMRLLEDFSRGEDGKFFARCEEVWDGEENLFYRV